jgi:hypothetical protein
MTNPLIHPCVLWIYRFGAINIGILSIIVISFYYEDPTATCQNQRYCVIHLYINFVLALLQIPAHSLLMVFRLSPRYAEKFLSFIGNGNRPDGETVYIGKYVCYCNVLIMSFVLMEFLFLLYAFQSLEKTFFGMGLLMCGVIRLAILIFVLYLRGRAMNNAQYSKELHKLADPIDVPAAASPDVSSA